ncbi:MAG: hypothetical protein CME06_14565 [Gemmatimonadetes bacterium]|nr:hypothetical protein [Gemmatimonadota bacterium]
MARLSEAYLRIDAEDSGARFKKTLALSAFRHAHGEREHQTRSELPVPGHTWNSDRLDDVARRAEDWLKAGTT